MLYMYAIHFNIRHVPDILWVNHHFLLQGASSGYKSAVDFCGIHDYIQIHYLHCVLALKKNFYYYFSQFQVRQLDFA